jgi:hypothetical protein
MGVPYVVRGAVAEGLRAPNRFQEQLFRWHGAAVI